MADDILRVIFLCTGNSCRSQMAEGLINHDFEGHVIAESAGVMPSIVNPYAIKVMAEIGIDISNQKSQHVEEFVMNRYDLVITLCSHADKVCPSFPNAAERVHIPFDDPHGAVGSEEEVLQVYRKSRDEIRERISEFLRQYLSKRN